MCAVAKVATAFELATTYFQVKKVQKSVLKSVQMLLSNAFKVCLCCRLNAQTINVIKLIVMSGIKFSDRDYTVQRQIACGRLYSRVHRDTRYKYHLFCWQCLLFAYLFRLPSVVDKQETVHSSMFRINTARVDLDFKWAIILCWFPCSGFQSVDERRCQAFDVIYLSEQRAEIQLALIIVKCSKIRVYHTR